MDGQSVMNEFDESEFHMVESEDLILNLERPSDDPPERAQATPEPASSEEGDHLVAAGGCPSTHYAYLPRSGRACA